MKIIYKFTEVTIIRTEEYYNKYKNILNKLKSGSTNPTSEDKRKPVLGAASSKADESKGSSLNSSTAHELKPPIIVIPNALTSTITANNAYEFLINSVYTDPNAVPPEVLPVDGNNPVNKAVNVHDRLCNTNKLQYKAVAKLSGKTNTAPPQVLIRIVDNPNKLTELEWKDQVVAVFATGQTWQFKNFSPKNMFPNAPIDLFQRVLGVHIMFDDQVVNSNVSSWNCKILKVG